MPCATFTIGAALCTLINPYGWKLYPWIFQLLGNPFFMNFHFEWQSPDFHEPGAFRFEFLLLLFPALLSLEFRERLEDLKIIGYARQEWTTEQFHENLRAAIDMSGVNVDKKYFERFIERIEFHGGDISVASLRGLKSALDGPAIFYLALPPGVFADAAEKIAKAGLADETAYIVLP